MRLPKRISRREAANPRGVNAVAQLLEAYPDTLAALAANEPIVPPCTV